LVVATFLATLYVHKVPWLNNFYFSTGGATVTTKSSINRCALTNHDNRSNPKPNPNHTDTTTKKQ